MMGYPAWRRCVTRLAAAGLLWCLWAGGRPASAAERVVLGEEFTNIWCGACAHAGPALSQLLDVYEGDFAFVQYHIYNNGATPWSDARWVFYNGEYTPTAVFNGHDILVGSVEDSAQQYMIYRVNHLLPERDAPTDVTLHVSAEPVTGPTYQVTVEVGIEPGGIGKTLRIYLVQVLDHWPPTKPYHRNGFKQAAPTVDVTLASGETQTVVHEMTFDEESWADQENIKLIAWAQAPADTGPAYVYQAAVRLWPLLSYPGDEDGDGIADEVDNCPERYNPDQADEDADGVGDVCDNCLGNENPEQADTDEDTIGDDCDNCPVLHALDQTDSDGDGVGDPCDACPEVPAPAGVDAFGRPLGCIDLDCDVDADDFTILAACLAGPGVTEPPPECTPEDFQRSDLDGDGDVDQADAALFSRNFTGPLVSPATYVGVANCVECHEEQHTLWFDTIHASAFNTLIEAGAGDNVLCFPCHSVGYGTASGFVDLDTTPELANVQCENCHGPGSNHVIDPENEHLDVNYSSQLCGACHQSCHGLCGENHHPQFEQWSTTRHATALADIQWLPEAQDDCLRCHSVEYRLAPDDQKPGLFDVVYGLECVTCHNQHGSAVSGQLRKPRYQLCADCHNMDGAQIGEEPAQTQAEILHGVGGYTLDWTPLNGPYSMHWWGIPDECVQCHMYQQPYGGPDEPVDSGHTFLQNMRACEPCHSEQVAGILVEATHQEMALRLATVGRYFDPEDPLYLDPTFLPPEEFLRYLAAKFDYEMVLNDRSFGTHNPDYTRALLSEVETFFGLPPWRDSPAGREHRARLQQRLEDTRKAEDLP